MANGAVIDFTTVVKINEGIKRIIRIASRINIVALNSMLRAKKAGRRAAGFNISSAEMRRISKHLDGLMEELRQLVFDLVVHVASARKRSRMIEFHRQARRLSGKKEAGLLAFINALETEVVTINEALANKKERLWLHLRRTDRITQMGMSAAKTLKIEAVYGGESAAELTQVSEAIETGIDELFATVRTLSRLTSKQTTTASVAVVEGQGS